MMQRIVGLGNEQIESIAQERDRYHAEVNVLMGDSLNLKSQCDQATCQVFDLQQRLSAVEVMSSDEIKYAQMTENSAKMKTEMCVNEVNAMGNTLSKQDSQLTNSGIS